MLIATGCAGTNSVSIVGVFRAHHQGLGRAHARRTEVVGVPRVHGLPEDRPRGGERDRFRIGHHTVGDGHDPRRHRIRRCTCRWCTRCRSPSHPRSRSPRSTPPCRTPGCRSPPAPTAPTASRSTALSGSRPGSRIVHTLRRTEVVGVPRVHGLPETSPRWVNVTGFELGTTPLVTVTVPAGIVLVVQVLLVYAV